MKLGERKYIERSQGQTPIEFEQKQERSSDQIMKGGLYSRYLNPKPIHVVTDLPIRYESYRMMQTFTLVK